mmetsp:Transcript_44517/g.53864  ORF Transcript_44517/g.53864 Transcript_44517/m.53864 type:complete len:227 (-) Transcript_44517:1135-1815(-)
MITPYRGLCYLRRTAVGFSIIPTRTILIIFLVIVRKQRNKLIHPTPPSTWRQLNNRMHWNLNRGTVLQRRVSKIRQQNLNHTDVTHNHNRTNLLFHVNNTRFQPTHQITIAFSPRKTRTARIVLEPGVPTWIHLPYLLQLQTGKIALIQRIQRRQHINLIRQLPFYRLHRARHGTGHNLAREGQVRFTFRYFGLKSTDRRARFETGCKVFTALLHEFTTFIEDKLR